MNTRRNVWLATGAMSLGAALSWTLLTSHDSGPATDEAARGFPFAAKAPAVLARSKEREELRRLGVIVETLHDTVERLDMAADRTRTRVETAEALARSALERVTEFAADLSERVLDDPYSDVELDSAEPVLPSPDPDSGFASHEDVDPIEQAAQSFYAQRVDQRRSKHVVSLFEEQMAQGALGNTDLVSAQCNDSTCRAVVQHQSGEDAMQFDLELPVLLGQQFDSFIVQRTDLGDGFSETEIYMESILEP